MTGDAASRHFETFIELGRGMFDQINILHHQIHGIYFSDLASDRRKQFARSSAGNLARARATMTVVQKAISDGSIDASITNVMGSHERARDTRFEVIEREFPSAPTCNMM